MTHPVNIEGVNLGNRELGYLLGGLRYDQLVEVLLGLAARLDDDARKDRSNKHRNLANELGNCGLSLGNLITRVEGAQRICAHYMVEEMRYNHPGTVTITRDDTPQ